MTTIPLAEPDFDMTIPHIVLHTHTQHCLGCRSTHTWSAVFECITKGRTKQYLPAHSLSAIPSDYRLVPISLPIEYIVICHGCFSTDAACAIPDHEAHRRWQQTLMRKNASPDNGGGVSRPPKVTPTLDML